MTEFLSSVSEIVTSLMTMFGSVSTALISNNIFMLIIGVIFLGILFGFVFRLVRRLKRN